MSEEQPNNPAEQTEQTEETPIFYDRREPQKIPLLVPKRNQSLRVTHHLKPLTHERYFQFDNEIEEVEFNKPSKLTEIYKPHFDLWKELLIERDGLKQSNSDALFFEAVQAVKALLYYEKVKTTAQPTDEPLLLDETTDTPLYFGAMFSGAWLGLELVFKSEFDYATNEYLQAVKPKRRWGSIGGLSGYRQSSVPFFVKSERAENAYKFALPFITKATGYAEAENIADVVPAWHVHQSADFLQSQAIQFLSDSPVINQVRGQ